MQNQENTKVTLDQVITPETPEAPKKEKEIKWSYSRLSTYKQCPFRFWLQYDQKHYVDTSTAATVFGTAIHEAEEDIANMIKEGKPIDYVSLKNKYIMANMKTKHSFFSTWYDTDKTGRIYEEKMYQYLEKGIYRLEKYMQDNPQYEIVGAEVPVDFRYEGKRFTGSIDRLLRNKLTGEYVIQDIKSWPRIDEHEEECTTPLQFVVYTLAAAEMYGIDPESISCQYDLPLANDGEGAMYDAGTKGFLKRGSAKLDKLFEGIESQDFHPNPSTLCHWCPFCATKENQPEAAKNLCPYYCLWTREHKTFAKEFEWQGMEHHAEILEEYCAKHPIIKK